MESAISTFCGSLATFCNHLDSSTEALSDSIQRRPVPLDSAASAFLQSLDRRISSASADLNLLESMALGTVSFEELLGHCYEVYNTNQKYITDIEGRMSSFGYVPEAEGDDDPEFASPEIGSKRLDFDCASVSGVRSNRKKLEEDLLFEDSLSLQNLGLSDACLATLASEASSLLPMDALTAQESKVTDGGATNMIIKIVKDDYDSLPSYMKSLASWEELQEAVAKLNVFFCKKEGDQECTAIDQHDIESLALGHKGRSYLLLLLRMKQLVVETVDGCIKYRACVG
ncbi:uncharacterized protein LOC109832904 [Asparagus officinalis]|uniref:uncharacterized protein LOC109832904 n=1 Tax=Asparagus officinalis TaxID=4686 RepID=UPI00098E1274|nr:uncharacterized protein LOC109832904 [Asparagus officinalis]